MNEPNEPHTDDYLVPFFPVDLPQADRGEVVWELAQAGDASQTAATTYPFSARLIECNCACK